MATIVVLDDEPQYLARIHALVEQCTPKDESRAIFDASSIDGLTKIISTDTHIDILITDIMMPEGQPSGIDIVQGFFPPSTGTQIIYMSGDLGQAPEVYRTSHVYFLLKPIDDEKLRDALRKAYNALPAAQPAMLRVKCGHKEQLINISSIRYLESNLHKALIHCGDRTFETYARLDELQARLPAHFSRCHRSFLVNLAYLKSFEGSEACLRDGTIIPVSRRKLRDVQHDLLTYLGSKGGYGHP